MKTWMCGDEGCEVREREPEAWRKANDAGNDYARRCFEANGFYPPIDARIEYVEKEYRRMLGFDGPQAVPAEPPEPSEEESRG